MRSFVKIKSSRIGEITLLFTDIGTLRPCHEFSALKICVLTLFAKKSRENFRIYSTSGLAGPCSVAESMGESLKFPKS